MPHGFSLHIGVNEVDQGHYQQAVAPLEACIHDAMEMQDVAHRFNYAQSLTLFNHEATRDRVKHEIRDIAHQMRAEDIFMLTFSGHGCQIPDADTGPDGEADGKDETWCLYDGQLLDDEIRQLFTGFPEDARIVVLSDSCHSGTAIHEWIHAFWGHVHNYMQGEKMKFRFLDEQRQRGIYTANQDFYENVREDIRQLPDDPVRANVCLISACQDNQRAVETSQQGAFTEAVKIALHESKGRGTYRQLHQEIFKHIRAIQSPNLLAYGKDPEQLLRSQVFRI